MEKSKGETMRINIGDFLTRRSRLTPDREGLVCEGVRRTYKDLNDRANRLANALFDHLANKLPVSRMQIVEPRSISLLPRSMPILEEMPIPQSPGKQLEVSSTTREHEIVSPETNQPVATIVVTKTKHRRK